MLVARCHIPGCRDTCGRRGYLCPTHGRYVPHALRVRLTALEKQARQGKRGAECAEAQVLSIRLVLLELWLGAFPVPPMHRTTLDCTCPLCEQARRTAPRAHALRRYVDTRDAEDD